MGNILGKEELHEEIKFSSTWSDSMTGLFEDRYQFIITLYLICRKTRNRLGIFRQPEFIKKQFRDYLRAPRHMHMCTFYGHTNTVRCFAVHGKYLYSGSMDESIQVWSTETYKHVASLHGHSGWVYCLKIHGNFLYSGSDDGTIYCWDLSSPSRELVSTYTGHSDWLRCMIIMEDKFLYSGSEDSKVAIWNIETHRKITTLEGSSGPVYTLVAHEQRLYAGCKNGLVVWNRRTNTRITTLQPRHGVKCIVVCSNNNELWAGSDDGVIRVWCMGSHELVSQMRAHGNFVNAMHVTNELLWSGSDDSTVCCWDINSHELVHTPRGEGQMRTKWVDCMTSDTDGKFLYTGNGNCTVHAWDTSNSHNTEVLEGHTSPVRCMIASQGLLFSGSSDSTIQAYAL